MFSSVRNQIATFYFVEIYNFEEEALGIHLNAE